MKYLEFGRSIKNKKIFVVIVAVSIYLLGVFLFKAYSENSYSVAMKQYSWESVSLIPTITPTPSPAAYVVQRKTSDGYESIFEFDHNMNGSAVRWKDKIYLSNYYGDQNNKLSIHEHDLVTGETKEIFKKDSKLIMSGLNIIDNSMFFSLGEYLKPGESYWIDLDSEDKKVNALASISGTVMKIKDRYYFISTKGDACWGSAYYALIDINTKVITPVVNTHRGCGGSGKDDFLGISSRDQMILVSQGSPLENYIGYGPPNLYTAIILIPLSDLKNKYFLVPPDRMPKEIIFAEYSDETDSFVLAGNEVYLYSFDTGVFEKIVDLPDEWIELEYRITLLGWKDNILCIEKGNDENSDGRIKLLVDLKKRTYSRDISTCPLSSNEIASVKQYSRKQEAENVLNELNLDSNYRIVERY